MHHAALVRVGERLGDVAQNADHLGDRQRPVAQPCAQRLALHERHRVVGEALRLTRRVHRDDIRVLQCRDRLDLAFEALDADPLRELGREDLHDDSALEAQLLGEEDARHPAAAEFTFERVGAAQGGLKLVAELIGQVRRGAGGGRAAARS